MKLARTYSIRGDVAAIVAVVVILGLAFFGELAFGDAKLKPNYGLGPEWDCVNVGYSDPACTRRIQN